MFNIIEKRINMGTRLVVSFGGAMFYIHFILLCLKVNSMWFPIFYNFLLNLSFIYSYYLWCKFGESDMSSFKLHGPFRPGLKRFKSEHGNGCMAFYPVSMIDI